jgi:hypothetical protein
MQGGMLHLQLGRVGSLLTGGEGLGALAPHGRRHCVGSRSCSCCSCSYNSTKISKCTGAGRRGLVIRNRRSAARRAAGSSEWKDQPLKAIQKYDSNIWISRNRENPLRLEAAATIRHVAVKLLRMRHRARSQCQLRANSVNLVQETRGVQPGKEDGSMRQGRCWRRGVEAFDDRQGGWRGRGLVAWRPSPMWACVRALCSS